MRLQIAFAFFLFCIAGSAWGQGRKSKIEALQQEVVELKMALAQCQVEKAIGPNKPLAPVLRQDREETHNKLLPLISAQSVENLAKAEAVIAQTDRFLQYCDDLKAALIQRAGPIDPSTGLPLDIRNKVVATQYLVEEKEGQELKDRIDALRGQYLSAVQNNPDITPLILLQSENLPPESSAPTWEAFKFKQMPLAAIFPILGKYIHDAKASEAAVLEYLSQ